MQGILVGAALVFIAANLYYFFANKTYRKSYFSTALFMKLFFVLCGVLLGFAAVYYVISLNEVILIDSLSSRNPIHPTFLDVLYFSGETLFSIGFGDMLPVGKARLFAVLEAMIGIILPAAYFMKALDLSHRSSSSTNASDANASE